MDKKIVFAIFLSFLFCFTLVSQNWTWMHGDSTKNQTDIYGTLGVASPTNKPGARRYSASWTDNQGKLWMFGGVAINAYDQQNDLWKYDPITNQWTWMHGANAYDQNGTYGTLGVASPSNIPGARSLSAFWKDNTGKFWLYGGFGWCATLNYPVMMDDLWMYDPSINQWTWMNGTNGNDAPAFHGTIGVASPSNTPGARRGATTWVDATGDLWLFGGQRPACGPNYNYTADLWKYSIATNQWTFMKGITTCDQPGVYGTLSVASPTVRPGGRAYAMSWRENTKLFLFGGQGYAKPNAMAELGDLWIYDISTNNWQWKHGFDTTQQNGIYGTLGVSAPTNKPGTRYASTIHKDNNGDVWMFGGMGWPISGWGDITMQDLWKYNSTSNEWAWMKGGCISAEPGHYGTKGVPAPAHTPSARFASMAWGDPAGDMWLFGGWGQGGGNGFNNDLWRFSVPQLTTTLVYTTNNLMDQLKIFPNPSSGKINFANIPVGGCGLNIYDCYGKLLCCSIVTSESFDISHLDPGVYTIQLNHKEGNKNFKLIKE